MAAWSEPADMTKVGMGAHKRCGRTSMNDMETRTLVLSFADLPLEVQDSVARFLMGRKLGEIVGARAHGVNETTCGLSSVPRTVH